MSWENRRVRAQRVGLLWARGGKRQAWAARVSGAPDVGESGLYALDDKAATEKDK